MGEHHANTLSFYLGEERDIYKWNAGCNRFRECNHFVDLLFTTLPKLSFLQCAAYRFLTSEWQLMPLKEVQNTRSPSRDRNHSHLFIWSRTRLNARGAHGSGFAYSRYQSACIFLEPHPHLLSLNGGQVSRQMANRQWASIPWGSTSEEWPFHAACQMGIM